MSQLSDVSILAAMESGQISITPWNESLLQPASVDLTLGTSWLTPLYTDIVSVKLRDAPYSEIDAQSIDLHPGQFILATTEEVVSVGTTLAAKFEGKSSLGRMGLMTHVTAGFIDPGFSGQITLELYNCGPWVLQLDAGIKIGQLVFTDLDIPASEGYGSKKWGSHYNNQRGATGVRK